MTLDEKRIALDEFCGSQNGCAGCPFNNESTSWCEECNAQNISEADLDIALKKVGILKDEVEPTPPTYDVVKKPDHYCHGGMECIEEMVLLFGVEATKHFCLLNAWKYRARAPYKNGDEDMQKSHRYIQFYKELDEYGHIDTLD